MNMAIVYESMYGNTHAIADAIAEGARAAGADVSVQAVCDASPETGAADLLVVGGPTHMHGLTSEFSRKMAASAAEEDEHALDRSATEGPAPADLVADADDRRRPVRGGIRHPGRRRLGAHRLGRSRHRAPSAASRIHGRRPGELPGR